MPGRVDRPVIGDGAINITNDIGETLLIGVGRGTCGSHLPILEIHQITYGGPHTLNARGLIDQARSDGGGQIIGVTHAVIAGKPVFAEELIVGEVVGRGVE